MLIGNMILVPTTVCVWQLVRSHSFAKREAIDSFIA
jgi:hypothetical protein